MFVFIYQIPNLDLDSEVPKDATKYNIRVTERGATFYEKVEIDEENQIAVFSVPAHNGLLRTDELFDFKTVSNTKQTNSATSCFVNVYTLSMIIIPIDKKVK